VPTRLRRRAGAAIRVGAPSGGSHTTIAALNDTTVDSLSWTGDGRRLVVVTRDAARTRVLAIDLAGEMTNLLSIPRGDVTVHPSPAGERVIVAEQDAAAASVQSVDASTGRQEWSAPVDGGADVTWSPSGSRLLVSDRRTWSFVEPATGIVRLKLGRVGDAPAWCCPTPAPAPPAANR
jgi:DNA-binding beta-propeller fold protein YncE